MPISLEFLSEKGYLVKDESQPWRHVVAVLEKDEAVFHLKMATSPEISKETQNEFAWNNLINSLPKDLVPFLVPKSYLSGNENGLFWVISEYIDGKPLAVDGETKDFERLEKNVDFIVDSSIAILNLPPDQTLPKDSENGTEKEKAEKFLAKIEKFAAKTTEDTSTLIEFIQSRLKFTAYAPYHGDFVPRHLLESSKGVFLIDGEHARMRGLKFYDVAYFYHRIYTKLQKPEIAVEFLRKFKEKYPMGESDQKCFELVLAARLVGGYMDAESDQLTSRELSKELEDQLLKGLI